MRAEADLPRILKPPTPGEPPRPKVPRPERWRLANGLRVVAIPRSSLPQVAMRLVVPAGSVVDPPERPGAAALLGALLSEGTLRLSPQELNARLDGLGASLGVQVGQDFAEVDLFLLSETLAEGTELLAELVREPGFPPEELQRAQDETLDALEARGDEPANVADDRLALELFGEHHPYGRLPMGTAAGVSAITRDELLALHRRHFAPDGSILVLAGDFELDALAALLERTFGAWSGSTAQAHYPSPPTRPAGAGAWTHLAWPDAAQGEIRLGGLGMPRKSPDWAAAAVANYILGGSTITGRLGANLREEKGWTYGVRSGFAAAVQPGGWAVETAVDGAVVEDAVTEIQRELARFAEEPVSEGELERARDALVLSLPRAFETPGRVVGRFAAVEAFGLAGDYWERFPEQVRAVTREDVLRVAREHFVMERLAGVVVGPDRS